MCHFFILIWWLNLLSKHLGFFIFFSILVDIIHRNSLVFVLFNLFVQYVRLSFIFHIRYRLSIDNLWIQYLECMRRLLDHIDIWELILSQIDGGLLSNTLLTNDFISNLFTYCFYTDSFLSFWFFILSIPCFSLVLASLSDQFDFEYFPINLFLSFSHLIGNFAIDLSHLGIKQELPVLDGFS